MVRAGVADAARVNARWCDTVCRAHGFAGTFTRHVWKSARRTPPLYPDAVTLTPDVTVPEVLEGIETSPGCSVKDSFGRLDLSQAGFEVLVEAEWIARMAQAPLEPGWSRDDDEFGDPAVAASFPGLPITGYERGDDLDAALRSGYTALGPLRVAEMIPGWRSRPGTSNRPRRTT